MIALRTLYAASAGDSCHCNGDIFHVGKNQLLALVGRNSVQKLNYSTIILVR